MEKDSDLGFLLSTHGQMDGDEDLDVFVPGSETDGAPGPEPSEPPPGTKEPPPTPTWEEDTIVSDGKEETFSRDKILEYAAGGRHLSQRLEQVKQREAAVEAAEQRGQQYEALVDSLAQSGIGIDRNGNPYLLQGEFEDEEPQTRRPAQQDDDGRAMGELIAPHVKDLREQVQSLVDKDLQGDISKSRAEVYGGVKQDIHEIVDELLAGAKEDGAWPEELDEQRFLTRLGGDIAAEVQRNAREMADDKGILRAIQWHTPVRKFVTDAFNDLLGFAGNPKELKAAGVKEFITDKAEKASKRTPKGKAKPAKAKEVAFKKDQTPDEMEKELLAGINEDLKAMEAGEFET